MFLVVAGNADVWCAGKKSHRIHDHQFAGDMRLSSASRSRAPQGRGAGHDQPADDGAGVPRSQLLGLLDANPKLAQSFQAALAAGVMRKMRDPEREDDEEQRNRAGSLACQVTRPASPRREP